jgi:hypothetical protein
MPRVLTRCPTTGEVVATQLALDERTFRSIRIPEFTLRCPLCSREHRWSGANAWLEVDAPPPLAGADAPNSRPAAS